MEVCAEYLFEALTMKRPEPQRVYPPEELAKDLRGLVVTELEGDEADPFLRAFFPLESGRPLDHTVD